MRTLSQATQWFGRHFPFSILHSSFGLGGGLIVLTGVLLALPFPPFDLTGLTWVALVPAVLAVEFFPAVRRRPFAAGYVAGLVSFTLMFWWIGHVTVLGAAALIAYLALYPALWLSLWSRHGLARCPAQPLPHLALAAGGACLWTVLEWIRCHFLTGFTWNLIGTGLWSSTPVAQLAWLGGVFLLSWLAVAVNLLLALQLRRVILDVRANRPRRPFWEACAALLLLALAFSFGLRRSLSTAEGPPRTLSFACIQPNIPQTAYAPDMTAREIIGRHAAMTRHAAQLAPEIIIWPEATTSVDPAIDRRFARLLTELAGQAGVPILFGAQDSTPGKVFNAAWLWLPDAPPAAYHKNNLVIFGEYVPLGSWVPFLRHLVPFATDFSAGDKPQVFALPPDNLRLAPLICFEDTLPDFVRKVGRLRPDLLVNMTNDSWFRDSPGAAQHLANAALRAVENDVPLIRAANTGVTAVIDARGRVAASLMHPDNPRQRVGFQGILSHRLVWAPGPPTPYQRWGDWVVIASALACAGWLAFAWAAKSAPITKK